MRKIAFITLSILIVALVVLTLFMSQLADIRPTAIRDMKEEDKESLEIKGRHLLASAWKAQGLDSLLNRSTYSVVATDHWQGILGTIGKLWPTAKADLSMDFATGTFTSRVKFLDGPQKGVQAGQQDWNYYTIEDGSLAFKENLDTKISFGLSAFQYFFELADRLQKAPIVYYAGRQKWEGKIFDLVFVSWNTTQPHQEHDQYLLYLQPETHRIQAASYTVRDNYLPGGERLYGSILFEDFRHIEGAYIPFLQTIFLNNLKKDKDQYIHQLRVHSFSFDQVPLRALYPDPDLPQLGDAK